MSRRFRVKVRLKPGDLVIRSHRLLKTQGTLLRFDGEDENGGSRAWIRWEHPTTRPNPSLERVDLLELATHGGAADEISPYHP